MRLAGLTASPPIEEAGPTAARPHHFGEVTDMLVGNIAGGQDQNGMETCRAEGDRGAGVGVGRLVGLEGDRGDPESEEL